MKRRILCFLIALLTASAVSALDNKPRKPSAEDKCPVCGMFIYKYPDWIAQIAFDDGDVYFFDGAKDMFKFYFNLHQFAPSKNDSHIAAVYVTEYYDMELIDARTAFFVIGSDVYGPMGNELIPFNSEADAAQFSQDHKGLRIVKFDRVKPSVIEKLD